MTFYYLHISNKASLTSFATVGKKKKNELDGDRFSKYERVSMSDVRFCVTLRAILQKSWFKMLGSVSTVKLDLLALLRKSLLIIDKHSFCLFEDPIILLL